MKERREGVFPPFLIKWSGECYGMEETVKMEKKPDIIFILTDDQGAWAMHCAGTPELYTPNLDRIASNGMRFENFFCASPVCSPARASLLTGKMPSSHGVHDWIRSGNVDREKFAEQGRENPYGTGYDMEEKPIGYLDEQIAYTDLLAKNGYQCALAGKWHLGDSVRMQHGFSRWYTLGLGGCCYYHPDIVEDGQIQVQHGKYVTELITDKALEWLDEFLEKDDPFYLSVHYTAPHSPWGEEQHPKKWIDYYRDCAFESIPDIPDHPDMTTGPVYGTKKRRENLIGYFAAISAMDEQVGRILDRLEGSGRAQDVLLIFAADNGMSMGQHGIWGKGNGTFPMNMYDTAVKVPFLVTWPGHIREGSVCEELISAYDLFPTLMSLAGIDYSSAGDLCGHSFADILCGTESGETEKTNKGIVVYDEYGPVRMIRTKEWKYVHRYPYGKNELYDLKEDPQEENNLYGQERYEEVILDLRKRLEGWFARYADADLDGVRQAVTGAGQLGPAGKRAGRVEIYAPVELI